MKDSDEIDFPKATGTVIVVLIAIIVAYIAFSDKKPDWREFEFDPSKKIEIAGLSETLDYGVWGRWNDNAIESTLEDKITCNKNIPEWLKVDKEVQSKIYLCDDQWFLDPAYKDTYNKKELKSFLDDCIDNYNDYMVKTYGK